MGWFLPLVGVVAGVKLLGPLIGLTDSEVQNVIDNNDPEPLKKALRDQYGITDTAFLEDNDVSAEDISILKLKGVPNDVIKLVIQVFGNKLNLETRSVFNTNVAEIMKEAIEVVISTIDRLINIIENNKNNFENLIKGIFDILRLLLNQLKEFSDLLPAGLIIGLIAPIFFLIASFISIF